MAPGLLRINRVIIPPQLVEDAMRRVPQAFKLYGRQAQHNIHYRPGCFYASTGGSAQYVLDLEGQTQTRDLQRSA